MDEEGRNFDIFHVVGRAGVAVEFCVVVTTAIDLCSDFLIEIPDMNHILQNMIDVKFKFLLVSFK